MRTSAVLDNYNNILAKAVNSDEQSLAYTSFEKAEGAHGWDYNLNSIDSLNSYTGNRSYNGNINKGSLPLGNYKVRLYARGAGSITINGANLSVSNNWKLITLNLSGITAVNISSNNNLIDEITICPQNSLASTYTHQFEAGITSETDAKGLTNFYEYDEFGDLKTVKDFNGNVRKETLHHFIQPFQSASVSSVVSDYYCPGSKEPAAPFTYTIPVGKYTSLVSQADADARAYQDVNSNYLKQLYASSHIQCGTVYSNQLISGEFTKNCSSGYLSTKVNYDILAGRFTSMISQEDADQKAAVALASEGQMNANEWGKCLGGTSWLDFHNSTSETYIITFSTRFTSGGSIGDYVFEFPPGDSSISLPTYYYDVTVELKPGSYAPVQRRMTTDQHTTPLDINQVRYQRFDVSSDFNFYIE